MAKPDAPPDTTAVTNAFLLAMQNAMAQGANSGASTSAKNDPMLYVGFQPGALSTIDRTGPTEKLTLGGDGEQRFAKSLQLHGGLMTQSQALSLWFDWTQADRLKWAKFAFAKGFISSPTDLAAAQDKWGWAVGQSIGYYNGHRQQKIDPWQALDMHVGDNVDELKKRALIGKDGAITHTNSNVNLMDKGHVEALATQVMQQALGRDPTQAEMNTYYATIRDEQQAHPQVTTTRTDAATGEQVGTGVTSGGFDETDAAELLKQRLQNDPEYAKFQAGTTYFNALFGQDGALSAIGGA